MARSPSKHENSPGRTLSEKISCRLSCRSKALNSAGGSRGMATCRLEGGTPISGRRGEMIDWPAGTRVMPSSFFAERLHEPHIVPTAHSRIRMTVTPIMILLPVCASVGRPSQAIPLGAKIMKFWTGNTQRRITNQDVISPFTETRLTPHCPRASAPAEP